MENSFDTYFRKSTCNMNECPYGFVISCRQCVNRMIAEHDKKIRAEVLREVESAMYHQCFECDNDEDMQKWDGGNSICEIRSF